VETELADRLRAADARDRPRLYGALYDELFRRVEDHPQHRAAKGGTTRARRHALAVQRAFIGGWLSPGATVLELGAGDAALSAAIAPAAGSVYALDVSEVVLRAGTEAFPANVVRLVYDGGALPFRDACLDVVFSNQLIEHLHPDDTAALLGEVFRVLRPGGVCLCITPNRADGPHDISGLMDDEARGFHLKEYTTADLVALFGRIGFRPVRFRLKLGLRFLVWPTAPRSILERALLRLPRRTRRAVTAARIVRTFLPHYVMALKPPTS
jgi:SAM-dependent methyltransferase